jgi:hypothetical protein
MEIMRMLETLIMLATLLTQIRLLELFSKKNANIMDSSLVSERFFEINFKAVSAF